MDGTPTLIKKIQITIAGNSYMYLHSFKMYDAADLPLVVTASYPDTSNYTRANFTIRGIPGNTIIENHSSTNSLLHQAKLFIEGSASQYIDCYGYTITFAKPIAMKAISVRAATGHTSTARNFTITVTPAVTGTITKTFAGAKVSYDKYASYSTATLPLSMPLATAVKKINTNEEDKIYLFKKVNA